MKAVWLYNFVVRIPSNNSKQLHEKECFQEQLATLQWLYSQFEIYSFKIFCYKVLENYTHKHGNHIVVHFHEINIYFNV